MQELLDFLKWTDYNKNKCETIDTVKEENKKWQEQ